MGQTNIKKVTLPDTVKTIGDTAFSGCTNLTSVNIPDGDRDPIDFGRDINLIVAGL